MVYPGYSLHKHSFLETEKIVTFGCGFSVFKKSKFLVYNLLCTVQAKQRFSFNIQVLDGCKVDSTDSTVFLRT